MCKTISLLKTFFPITLKRSSLRKIARKCTPKIDWFPDSNFDVKLSAVATMQSPLALKVRSAPRWRMAKYIFLFLKAYCRPPWTMTWLCCLKAWPKAYLTNFSVIYNFCDKLECWSLTIILCLRLGVHTVCLIRCTAPLFTNIGLGCNLLWKNNPAYYK